VERLSVPSVSNSPGLGTHREIKQHTEKILCLLAMETIEPAECIGVGGQPILEQANIGDDVTTVRFLISHVNCGRVPYICQNHALQKCGRGYVWDTNRCVSYRRGRRTVICLCRASILAISCSIFVSIGRMDSRNGPPFWICVCSLGIAQWSNSNGSH